MCDWCNIWRPWGGVVALRWRGCFERVRTGACCSVYVGCADRPCTYTVLLMKVMKLEWPSGERGYKVTVCVIELTSLVPFLHLLYSTYAAETS